MLLSKLMLIYLLKTCSFSLKFVKRNRKGLKNKKKNYYRHMLFFNTPIAMSLWSKSICKVKKTINIFSSENILVYSYDANFLQEESSFYDFIKNIRGYRYTSWPILGETGPVPESKFSVQPWMFETEKKGSNLYRFWKESLYSKWFHFFLWNSRVCICLVPGLLSHNKTSRIKKF